MGSRFHNDTVYVNFKRQDHNSRFPATGGKCSFLGYTCTLKGEVYIPNCQRATPDVHTTLAQLKTPYLFIYFFVLNWSA